jgi:formylglycine-generating enzyme required for sulfatase activity
MCVRARLLLVVAAVVASSSAAACGAFSGENTSTTSDGGDASADGATASSDGAPSTSPDGGASGADGGDASSTVFDAGTCAPTSPDMVQGSGFMIDRTEVTLSQYQSLQGIACAALREASSPAVCAFKQSIFHGGAALAPDDPVTVVDYCDAFTYCQAVGKRLCGSTMAGALPQNDVPSSVDEWYRACTNDLASGVPTSDGTCVLEHDAGPLPVTTKRCVGGYPDLQDMMGNVWEWIDACASDAGPTDDCIIIGGSYLDSKVTTNCGSTFHPMRQNADYNIGFRCCK